MSEGQADDSQVQERQMDKGNSSRVLYGIDEPPSPLLWPVFGIQQALMCISGTLSVPVLTTNQICARDLFHVRSKLLSISFFVCGVATFLQNTIGIRLPIVQGGSSIYIAPIVAMMALDKWRCPETDLLHRNATSVDEEPWLSRMREIQGNMMLASLTQVVLGATGIMGFLLRFIGPLTIAPTIAIIGLFLSQFVVELCEKHWGIAICTSSLILIFTLFLGNIRVPLPAFTWKRKCHMTLYPLFHLTPVILSVGISWLLCHILTITDALPSNSTETGYSARTDHEIKLEVLEQAPWVTFPYPLQFGTPTVSAAGYVGMLAATIASIIESVGDYFAAARVADVMPPPPHAVNRGVAMEGFSSIISGLLGAGHATTSYSENIGAIAVTKVASRRVFQTAGIFMILCGIVGKVGGVFAMIPDPVIGGLLIVSIGMVTAIGISTLQFVDLTSSRNLVIIGVAMLVGLAVPRWITAHPNALKTGSEELNQVLSVLLGTPMFVGGFIGCFLDSLVPGTAEERGTTKWRQRLCSSDERDIPHIVDCQTYDLPLVTACMRKLKCCSYVPMSPTFDKDLNCCQKIKKTRDPNKYVFDHQIELESTDRV